MQKRDVRNDNGIEMQAKYNSDTVHTDPVNPAPKYPMVNSSEFGAHGQEHQELLDFEKGTKAGFLRKVYGILLTQLFITFFMCYSSSKYESFGDFCGNIIVVILSIILMLTSMILLFIRDLGRTLPYNYILLMTFTLCEGIIVSSSTRLYDSDTVLFVVMLTCITTLFLSSFSFFIRKEMTMGISLGVLMLSFMFQIFALFFIFTDMGIASKLISLAGSFIYGLYIVLDTQILLERVAVDDYIYGALMVYLDVITLFIYLLSFFAKRR